jgi:transcriptional regulator with XRE-family HTH domain
MEKTIHQGRNIKRFREMLGIKQDALAAELGEDWDQVKVSRLEAKEEVENAILKQVSAVLKVPVEAIENFDEEMAINVIGNTYHDSAVSNVNYGCTFNPIDKIVELYEEVLKVEREKNALLERMIELRK